jgi:hypothetical protein
MRRALLIAAALAIPVSALVLDSSPAWAGTKITCTNISGTAGSLTISGCTGGTTGGGANNVNGSVLASGGTVTWISGSKTTIGLPTLVTTSAKKCPGYVKGATTEPLAEKFSAGVSADTGDGIKIPGKAKGAVCISAVGANVSVLKKFVIS